VKEAETTAYFQEAASWESDRAAQAGRRARAAVWTAAAGWTCAVSCATALAFALPLKTVQPYVIRVDNSSGIVDVVPAYEGHAELGETVARFLLTHYVTLCEGFNYSTAERDYAECGAYHSVRRNQDWYQLWNPVNPSSPLNQFKDGTSVRVQVTSVSFFKRATGLNDLAQVRYLKAKRLPGATEQISHWIATIEYGYVPPSKDAAQRQFNPLGFRVTDFRSESELTQSPSTTGGH
jgi:type IV secretion system protein VirB8